MQTNRFVFNTKTLMGVCLNWMIVTMDSTAIVVHHDDLTVIINDVLQPVDASSGYTAIPVVWAMYQTDHVDLPPLLKQLEDAICLRQNIEYTIAIYEYVIHPNQLDIFNERTLEYRTKMFGILMKTWGYRQQAAVNIGSILFGDKIRTVTEAVGSAQKHTFNERLSVNVAVLPIRFAEMAASRLIHSSAEMCSGVVLSPTVGGYYITTCASSPIAKQELEKALSKYEKTGWISDCYYSPGSFLDFFT